MELCTRALDVLNRQLALRKRLELEGKIHHDHLFFKETGEPICSLQYPYRRWRWTLRRNSTIRYRKPYCARHSSVSWDLMVGRNPLWVAKQHGHSITTMLRAYAAWAEGAIEADIEAIQHAMDFNPRATRKAITGNNPAAAVPSLLPQPLSIVESPRRDHLAVDLPVATLWQTVTRGIARIVLSGTWVTHPGVRYEALPTCPEWTRSSIARLGDSKSRPPGSKLDVPSQSDFSRL
jgi:hypothetical protein